MEREERRSRKRVDCVGCRKTKHFTSSLMLSAKLTSRFCEWNNCQTDSTTTGLWPRQVIAIFGNFLCIKLCHIKFNDSVSIISQKPRASTQTHKHSRRRRFRHPPPEIASSPFPSTHCAYLWRISSWLSLKGPIKIFDILFSLLKNLDPSPFRLKANKFQVATLCSNWKFNWKTYSSHSSPVSWGKYPAINLAVVKWQKTKRNKLGEKALKI